MRDMDRRQSTLQATGQLRIDPYTLYTAAALQDLLPRKVYETIRATCPPPIQGFYWGGAIIDALNAAFTLRVPLIEKKGLQLGVKGSGPRPIKSNRKGSGNGRENNCKDWKRFLNPPQ